MTSFYYISNWILRKIKKRSLNELHIKRDVLNFKKKVKTLLVKRDVCKCKL